MDMIVIFGLIYHGGCMNTKRNPGFTLAEVLITLGIIGVVAAMTLPTLVAKYQKQVVITKLKSTYSILNQAIKMSEIDNGPVAEWDMGERDMHAPESKVFAEKYLIPYLKVAHKCENISDECLSEKIYYLNGTEHSYRNNFNLFALTNGVIIGVWPRGNITEVNIIIKNGNKHGLMFGKNCFLFVLSKQALSNSVFGKFPHSGLYPYGYGYDRDYLKTAGYPCAKTGNVAEGVYCAALIMYDGWEIKDDYPW